MSISTPIMDTFDMISNLGDPPKDIVKGVFCQGAKGVLGGASKSKKTWLMSDLAFSVAYGIPWIGLETTQAPVLVLDLELMPYFSGFRLREIAQARGIKFESGRFKVWNLRGECRPYTEMLPEIAARIQNSNYGLIEIDPIYKILGNSVENAAEDVAQMLNAIEKFTKDTRASTFFAAHFPKGNMSERSSIDRISGSGVFARDPDTIITITEHKQPDCFTAEFTLRNHPPVEPFVIRWKYPLMVREPGLDPDDIKKSPSGRPKEHEADDLLSLLPSSGFCRADWLKAAEERFGVSESTFKRNVKVLESGGMIEQTNGTWFRVPMGDFIASAKNGKKSS